ncbi:hypothetical protein PYCC9005_000883 [Savitreella phatthalungensis]
MRVARLLESLESESVTAFISSSHDSAFNLALEDALFNRLSGRKAFLFYCNRPSVIIGRNQNPWLECDPRKLARSSIQLMRRFSGGGAVYHDLGNLNYVYYTDRQSFDRRFAIQQVSDVLNGLDRATYVNERHDLIVRKGKMSYKCSGSAFKISKDRAYAHGTLLLNSDIASVRDSLQPAMLRGKILDAKGVGSVRSAVANVDVDQDVFMKALVKHLGARLIQISPDEELLHDLGLTLQKLLSWDWIYGQTPEFMLQMPGMPSSLIRNGRHTSSFGDSPGKRFNCPN